MRAGAVRVLLALLAPALMPWPTLADTPTKAQAQSFGTWTNPSRSVQVRAHPCGRAMCGSVVWANATAQADARRGGTEKLIGAELFKDFVQESDSVWRGRVYVPDIDKTFSGTITVVDPRTLRASGCLIGRIGCKSQVWTRVEDGGR
jgi:uncharacterized protein (DUF2147 family)